ncbi:MAG: sigma-70 family RNA polymerase sigma factor [Agriterribacter sp.]
MSNYFNHTENEIKLLSQVREGDVKAFECVYNMYSGRLYGNILKLVKSPLIAEELLQDIFQRVWEHRKNIDTTRSFKSYLFTIAKNLVCDYFNNASRQRLVDRYLQVQEEKQLMRVEHVLEEKESELILRNAVRQLPPQRKLVYTLCKIEGKSYEDVSKALNISVSTISDHIVKASKSIKAYYLSKDMLYVFILILTQL